MRTKRALISVFDKSGIVDFAKSLNSMGWEIISTGGTSKKLKEEGLQVKDISDLTQFPECFDGRVKTLHPNVEGGILAIRDNEKHKQQMAELGIEPIDMVVCNLYPFKETILKAGVSHEEIIENIDIGGPTMIRAAAKNYPFVTVITDPEDYTKVIEEIQAHGDTSLETKELLAAKVFIHTSHYDALIANYFSKRLNIQSPKTLTLTFEKKQDLRYGENPHQSATFYTQIQETEGTLTGAVQLHGKELYRALPEGCSFDTGNSFFLFFFFCQRFDAATGNVYDQYGDRFQAFETGRDRLFRIFERQAAVAGSPVQSDPIESEAKYKSRRYHWLFTSFYSDQSVGYC